MVKNGCQFNENRLLKVSKIISSIIDGFCYNSFTELFLEEIRQRCPIRATAGDTLSFMHECLRGCSQSSFLAIISSKLFPRILSTPHWRDLSVIEDKGLLNDILGILIITIQLTTPDSLRYISTTTDTDPQSIRNVVLHEVLIPMEQSFVQISLNPRLSSWNDESRDTFRLLINIFDLSASHQPTLNFVCSSRIPMAFQSLLSNVEDNGVHQGVLCSMFERINNWKTKGAEIWRNGRILLQTLEQEGFHERLEQTLLHDDWMSQAQLLRNHTFRIMDKLGTNCCKPS